MRIIFPESYSTLAQKTFPVIYLTDGDRYFGLASDLVSLLLHREGIDAVLVGVGYGSRQLNDAKRRRDYSGEPVDQGRSGATAYHAFLAEELIPKLESEFRFDPERRTLVGWSRGAMFTLYAMFRQPELFDSYLVLSPRLNYPNWSGIQLERQYGTKRNDLPARLYFAIGTEDERYVQVPELIEALERRGYTDFELQTSWLAGREHDVFALSEGMAEGLQHLFHREPIDQLLRALIDQRGLDHAVSEYRRLQRSDPEGYDFSERRLNELGYHYLAQKSYDEAIAVLQLNVESYPESFNTHDSLGEAYMNAGHKELALSSYRRSLELNPQNENAEQQIDRLQAMARD
ncbi:MAG: alpha/beta hydrolase-fold protein [Acidobacteriota bacterium]